MRLARGATKQQAIEEACKEFAHEGLRSVPPILDHWNEVVRSKGTTLRGWKARKVLGLP